MAKDAGGTACWPSSNHFSEDHAVLSEAKANALKKRHSPRLMRLPGVCGVGVEKDNGGFTVVVHLQADDATIRTQLPADLDGERYKVIVSGPFVKR
jgi:hypothetical protein